MVGSVRSPNVEEVGFDQRFIHRFCKIKTKRYVVDKIKKIHGRS
jgi:hypothetical protein